MFSSELLFLNYLFGALCFSLVFFDSINLVIKFFGGSQSSLVGFISGCLEIDGDVRQHDDGGHLLV